MRVPNSPHSIVSFLLRLGNMTFLCCFFVFFLFRNELAYIIEHAIESTHLGVKYELFDDDISEIEIEKQEVILSDVFIDHFNSSCCIEERLIKNPGTSQASALSVYLEVLSPPPWSAA